MRTRSLPANANTKSFLSSDSVELDDLSEKPARLTPTISPLSPPPPPYDFERTARFMAWGFIMAPIQLGWYGVLTKWFPITSTRGMVPALQRVTMDQLMFAPVSLGAFFTFITVAEGGGRRAVVRKFQDLYVPTLRANYILWPAVQIVNFRLMPRQFQVPFVSTVGIAWTAYLSLTNSTEAEEGMI